MAVGLRRWGCSGILLAEELSERLASLLRCRVEPGDHALQMGFDRIAGERPYEELDEAGSRAGLAGVVERLQ